MPTPHRKRRRKKSKRHHVIPRYSRTDRAAGLSEDRHSYSGISPLREAKPPLFGNLPLFFGRLSASPAEVKADDAAHEFAGVWFITGHDFVTHRKPLPSRASGSFRVIQVRVSVRIRIRVQVRVFRVRVSRDGRREGSASACTSPGSGPPKNTLRTAQLAAFLLPFAVSRVVARPGIEPGTQGFSVLCSTN